MVEDQGKAQSELLGITEADSEASSAKAEEVTSEVVQDNSPVQRRYWVATYPFFESTLFLTPPRGTSTNFSASLSIFDCDGDQLNQVSLAFEGGAPAIVELDQFMGACKLESGFKHGQIVLEAPASVQPLVRLHTESSAAVLGSPQQVEDDGSVFFPVSLGEERSNILCVVNSGDTEARVKCRLFLGKRTPDVSLHIPGNGSRMFSVEAEFSDFIKLDAAQLVQAYLRLTTRSTEGVGIQVLERIAQKDEQGVISSVT